MHQLMDLPQPLTELPVIGLLSAMAQSLSSAIVCGGGSGVTPQVADLLAAELMRVSELARHIAPQMAGAYPANLAGDDTAEIPPTVTEAR